MRIRRLLLFILPIYATIAFGQVRLSQDPVLDKAIVQSGLLHSPLPLDNSRSYETYGAEKKVLSSKTLSDMKNLSGWTHSGLGEISHSTQQSVSGNGSLKLAYATHTGKRIQGPSSDPDYATYGNSRAVLHLDGANWENYNRIVFYIYPDCEGARVVNMNLSISNDAKTNKNGYNRQSGEHLINLVNHQWNRCFLDIDEYQRDHIKQISFSSTLRGKDRTTGDSVCFYIDKIELQQIENPEIVSGWMPGHDKIVYSTTGYMLNSPKTAIINSGENKQGNRFQLINSANNQVVFNGVTTYETTTLGKFEVLDFSSLNTPGSYQIKVGDLITPPFTVGENVWENSLWKTLNFIFCQRCGHPVPGIHGTCHTDLCAIHEGEKISYAGGWHDAGDLSQQTLQTGDITYTLLEAYNALKDKNELLAARMLEEAEWGLEFILRTRFGDGYRASSVGLLIWLDGIFDTMDDINTVRVQNLAHDNFLYAAYEAYAAMTIDRDPMLQEYLVRIAKEDFEFAMQRHKEVGYGEFIHFYEHSYNTSES